MWNFFLSLGLKLIHHNYLFFRIFPSNTPLFGPTVTRLLNLKKSEYQHVYWAPYFTFSLYFQCFFAIFITIAWIKYCFYVFSFFYQCLVWKKITKFFQNIACTLIVFSNIPTYTVIRTYMVIKCQIFFQPTLLFWLHTYSAP